MNIGDRVRYIHKDTKDDKKTGYYPPVGTLGNVIDMDGDGPYVKWDSGTKGSGEWWCNYEDVEVACEATEAKTEPCWLCDDCDTLYQIVCYLPNDNGGAKDIPIHHCPVCGRQLEEVQNK